MGDRADRPRRSERAGRARTEAAEGGPRRGRVLLYAAGGLLGPGCWLCGAAFESPVLGKAKADVHFAEFVIASGVVVVASWGLLLIIGEAMLFALAVVRADDRERYDIYRNLMILWGYVLTLGIPRHFRRLPAQFESWSEDERTPARAAGCEDAPNLLRRTEGTRRPQPKGRKPGDVCRREESRAGGRPGQEDPARPTVPSAKRTAAPQTAPP